MVFALHIWFNFIIIGPVHTVLLILQIGFHVGVFVFKTLLLLLYIL
jgi:hypothetical protein